MTLPHYPFYWSDYSGKTFNLTQGQHGAYFLLMRHIYTSGASIEHEERYSIAKAVLQQEQENVDFVLRKYFRRDGDVWVNDTCLEVMQEALDLHEKRKKAGKKGGKTKSSNAKAELEQNPSGALPTKPKPKSIPSKKETPLPPKLSTDATKGGSGFDKNGIGKVAFSIEPFLKDEDREAARRAAPGWDLHALMEIYNEGRAERGIPTHPAKAFLGWVKSYTKGKAL